MGSMTTGEMFSQEEYDAMPIAKREELQVVGLTPQAAS